MLGRSSRSTPPARRGGTHAPLGGSRLPHLGRQRPRQRQALAWLAPAAVAKTTRRIAERWANENGADLIDWNVERPRIEHEVLAKNFRARSGAR